jgi:AraC-like DNA-binding protein
MVVVMDVLGGLLAGPRAREAFLVKALLDPPWSLRVEDRAPLALVYVLRGHAWVLPDREDGGAGRVVGDMTGSVGVAGTDAAGAVRVEAGDVVIARGPTPYTVADTPDTEPRVFVGPDEVCRSLDGRSLVDEMMLGVRTWGNSRTGEAAMVIGVYTAVGETGQWLLQALPAVAVVRSDEWSSPLPGLLSEEVEKEQPGQQVVLDRLLDLVLVGAVREWLTRHQAPPGWYGAVTDPVIGPAVRALQERASEAWTVERLAAEVGVARATLARRFAEVVGQPPMAFLAEWRVALASDLLQQADASVTSVAREVGYATPYAFSTAFKRIRGLSPHDYRTKLAAV